MRSAEQPQIGHQPLQQSTRLSESPSTWVENLRHEVQNMPIPGNADLGPYDTELLVEMTSLLPPELMESLQLHNVDQSASPTELSASVATQDMQPSAEFEADAAYLQSAQFGTTDSISTVGTDTPPQLPALAPRDWYLPPPELATSLLAEFINDFNTAVPLYQPDVLVSYLRTCYAGTSEDDTIAWTSAYIVFGLAHTLRAMSPIGTTQDTSMARYYLAKIYTALTPLLCAPPSLSEVQCLLGVALLITYLPCRYDMNEGHFVATALRVIQGLSYKPCTIGTPLLDYTSSTQQQRRVFWLAFIADTMASIVTNSSTTYHHEDVMQCSPEMAEFLLDPSGAVVAAEGHWRVNIFNLRVKLALLQAEANDQILTSRSRSMGPIDVELASAIVLARLEEFHSHEIFNLDVQRLFQLLYRSDICHVVSLEAAYFATVYRLHAFAAYERTTSINPFSLGGLKITSEMRHHKSYGPAHRLLSLLSIAPQGDVGLYWHSHTSMIAALVTVLAQHINNRTEQLPTPEELEVYGQFLLTLGEMVHSSGHGELARLREFCMSLFTKFQQLRSTQSPEHSGPNHGSVSTSTPSSRPNLDEISPPGRAGSRASSSKGI